MPSLAQLDRDVSWSVSTLCALLSVIAPVMIRLIPENAIESGDWIAPLGGLLTGVWVLSSVAGTVLGLRRGIQEWSIQRLIEATVSLLSAAVFVYTVAGIEPP